MFCPIVSCISRLVAFSDTIQLCLFASLNFTNESSHHLAHFTKNQKFPVNRSDAVKSGANDQPTAQANNQNNNNNNNSGQTNNSSNNNGPQQLANGNLQYSITIPNNNNTNPTNQVNEQQQAISDKQLLSNGGLVGVNSFQFQNSNSKQREMHHSVLQPNSNLAPSHRSHPPHHHHQQQLQLQLNHQRGTTANKKGSTNVNFCRAWLNKFPSRSKRIDVISRIFFPKMFALFNLVYWTTYLFREDDIAQS